MFLHCHIRTGGLHLFVAVLMLTYAPATMCQSTPADESEPPFPEEVEEIIVYGEQSLVRLRHQMYKAEATVFDIFNSLNSNRSFDVKCDYVTDLATRRKHHECVPNFVKTYRARAASTQTLFNEFDAPAPSTAWVRRMDELLWKEMAELVARHPELKDAFADLDTRKKAYDTEREGRKNN